MLRGSVFGKCGKEIKWSEKKVFGILFKAKEVASIKDSSALAATQSLVNQNE